MRSLMLPLVCDTGAQMRRITPANFEERTQIAGYLMVTLRPSDHVAQVALRRPSPQRRHLERSCPQHLAQHAIGGTENIVWHLIALSLGCPGGRSLLL
jgi:hypothetical protein